MTDARTFVLDVEPAPRAPRAAVINAIAWLGVEATAPAIRELTGLTEGQVKGLLKREIDRGDLTSTRVPRGARYSFATRAQSASTQEGPST